MRKYFKVLSVLFIALIALTGCGGRSKKTLTCTMESSESGINTELKVKAQYDGEKLNNLTVTGNVDVDEQYAGSMGILKTSLDASLKEQFDDIADSTFDSKVSGNKYSFTLESKNPAGNGENKSYDDTKAYFEASGFSCK